MCVRAVSRFPYYSSNTHRLAHQPILPKQQSTHAQLRERDLYPAKRTIASNFAIAALDSPALTAETAASRSASRQAIHSRSSSRIARMTATAGRAAAARGTAISQRRAQLRSSAQHPRRSGSRARLGLYVARGRRPRSPIDDES